MTDIGMVADRARAEVRQAVRKASPFVGKFARVGYAAKGVIYCVVGALAALSAFGFGGETTGSKGALDAIAGQPFGWTMLLVVALGLACYALWQFMRAVEDPENEGSDGKGLVKRAGFLISGVVHAALVIYASHTLLGTGNGGGGGGDDAGARSWSGTVMSYPFGRVVLGLIGAGIAVYGLFQLYKAYKAQIDKMLMLGQMSAGARRWVTRLSRFGMAARGVVFGMIGTFLILAAVQYDAGEARGLGGALEALRDQPLGKWLLGLVALGLVAYGLFQFIKARYRYIQT